MADDSTRERLLDAAAREFAAHGVGPVSIDAVRRRAGASNGSTYHHFPNKAALADAVYARTLRDFHAALVQPLRTREAKSAEAAVKGLVRAYVLWVLRHPDQARLLDALKRHGSDLPRDGGTHWQAANQDGLDWLAQWVAGRCAAGEMKPLRFDVWMALVFAPALSLSKRWLAQQPPQVPPGVRQALEHAAWAAVAP
jgi:AcrR family transcriptional regulator